MSIGSCERDCGSPEHQHVLEQGRTFLSHQGHRLYFQSPPLALRYQLNPLRRGVAWGQCMHNSIASLPDGSKGRAQVLNLLNRPFVIRHAVRDVQGRVSEMFGGEIVGQEEADLIRTARERPD